jgi:hypothetical protein
MATPRTSHLTKQEVPFFSSIFLRKFHLGTSFLFAIVPTALVLDAHKW